MCISIYIYIYIYIGMCPVRLCTPYIHVHTPDRPLV